MAGPDKQLFDERRRMDSPCPIFMIWFFVDRVREFEEKSNHRHVQVKSIKSLGSKESLVCMGTVKGYFRAVGSFNLHLQLLLHVENFLAGFLYYTARKLSTAILS